jgi:hypothetical protein
LESLNKAITVFIPSENADSDRKKLQALRSEGNVLVLARKEQDLRCGAEPGVWTLLAPQQHALYEWVLQKAARIVAPGLEEEGPAQLPSERHSSSGSLAEDAHFAFCCVADTQYVPFFFALVENLKAVHPGTLEIHLLAADAHAATLVRAQYPNEPNLRIYEMKDVWEPAEWERIASRPLSLQALSSKPRILLKARENSEAQAIFLLDLDIYFFRSPSRLNACFGKAHTLFFPQWSDRFTWARLHGVLNSGMVGARKGAEPLLKWWSEACWISCELNVETGRFGDQAFIDQALCYFDGIRIYRELDEDVAPWNSQTLNLQWSNASLTLADGRPVGSYHAAGPDSKGVFELKYAWDQVCALFSVITDPNESRALFRNTLEQQRRHWPDLDRALRIKSLFENRTRLPVAHTTPDWAERAVTPEGVFFFKGLDRVHALYRRIRSQGELAPTPNNEYTLWVQLQRKVLQGLNSST